jgi:putative heme iron utilization protein
MNGTIEQAQKLYDEFTIPFKSIILGTAELNGEPNASYAPFIMDENQNIYIYISYITQHAKNIANNENVSVMFIEDEKESGKIFARKRLTYQCKGKIIPFDTEKWQFAIGAFTNKFGKIIENFKSMEDFNIFQLIPNKGRFVIGFGAAYDIEGANLKILKPVAGQGHGHKPRHGHGKESNSKDAVNHMNTDHRDSVLNIAKVYGKQTDAIDAELLEILSDKLLIRLTLKSGKKDIEVKLITSPDGNNASHGVLITMSKESRRILAEEAAKVTNH